MFIPIGHDRMSARRWPVMTIALITINLAVFLSTFSSLQKDAPELAVVKEHMLRLAAMHSELEVPDTIHDIVAAYAKDHPDEWVAQSSESRPIADVWDARVRGLLGAQAMTPNELQAEMDSLTDKYLELTESSVLEQYAYVPAKPTALSYLTANFMHGGWFHLLGNMWFLWLAGVVLEDIWGRVAFPMFYLAGGVVALLAQGLMNPGSLTPVLGASGAVAALMGAFMVRFPLIKIKIIGLVVFRPIQFEAAAIWLFPFWLASEVFFGFVWGGYSGVAHWAHVGGFLFGAAGAFVLRFTGIERKLDERIVGKINEAAPATLEAEQLIEEGEFNAAEIALKDLLETNPGSIEALKLLQAVQWRKNDIDQYQQTTLTLCQAHLKARDTDAAWQCYEDFLNSGGRAMPPSAWLDVTRLAEESQRYEDALAECEKLAAAYPGTREALMAQIRAGRICQKQFVQPEKALLFYEAAYSSPVPHLDMEQTILVAIRECKAAMSLAGTPTGRSARAGQ